MRGIIRDNSNSYDGSEIEERNEDENIGVEGSAQLTLVNSHLLTLNTLLTDNHLSGTTSNPNPSILNTTQN